MPTTETTQAWKPTKEKAQLLSDVKKRIYAMELHKQGLHLYTDWDKWEKQTLPGEATRSSELNVKNPSKVKNALTRMAVYSILAMAVARNNETQLIAHDEGDQKVAPVLQAVSDHLVTIAKEKVTRIKNLLTTIKLGMGVRKRIYRCDVRTVKEIVNYDPATEKGEYKEVEYRDYDDADLKDIDPRYFFWDERATSHDDMRDCAERMIIPYSALKDEYPIKKFPNVKYVTPGGWFADPIDEKRAEPIFTNVGEDNVEVFEYYNKLKDQRLIIANGVILQDIPIPRRDKQLPYTVSVFQLRDGKAFAGIGLPELVEHDQALLDTLYNIAVDWIKLAINKPALKGGGESPDTEEKFELEPGKQIEVTDVNNYKFLDIPDIDRGFFEVLDKIEENAKKKVGIDDPMFGVGNGGTATESAIATQAAKEKLDLFFTLLEEDVDVRDERLKLDTIQQFYSQPRIKKITGEDGEEIEQQEYRKLPLNLKPSVNEFGEESYEKSKNNYFELKPETLGVSDDKYAQFTVKIVSRSTMPVSKELRKKYWDENIAMIRDTPKFDQRANWDKLWKKQGEVHEFDAEDYSATGGAEDDLLQLAQDENDRMMQGEDIPPTQGATEAHTDVHRALATSSDMQTLQPEVQQIIVKHYEGELAEQRVGAAEGTYNEAVMLNPKVQSPMLPMGQPGQTGGQPATRQEVTGQPPAPQPESVRI